MIVQSPESAMPEPYRTYVRQRNETISSVLGEVVKDNNVQLCPRAITSDEQIFPIDNSYIYGVVVKELKDGYKSVLYSNNPNSIGIATSSLEEAKEYTEAQIKRGNRVRIKDPRESDGRGQYTVESTDELLSVFHEINKDSNFGCVLMPYLDRILHRISVGHIALGKIGEFTYLGREETVTHGSSEVYGGTTLGLFHSSSEVYKTQVERYFDIPPYLTDLGKKAILEYVKLSLRYGRVSVDVVEGVTDSGEIVRDVIDVTPRVGGTTPAETLSLAQIHTDQEAVCYASSKLIYDPIVSPTTGVNFVDTDTLVINAQIHDVIK